jgi:alpha-amylase
MANQIRGYHGYWAIDFYQTNKNFGSIEKLKELVTTAHIKGIKVILDLVVNHVSPAHPWVGDPRYDDWFHQRGAINNWNDQLEIEEGNLANLPDLDQSNPEVKKYLIDMAKWWIKETGIDGYRLDTVRHVSKEFWSDFAAEIKAEYPDFYLLGEVWDGRTVYLAGYQEAGLDGLVDFPLYYAITDVFKNDRPASRLTKIIEECHNRYPNPYLMGTFIDNHDLPRFMDQLYDLQEERLKQALAFMMTYTGIPVVYYGTEIGHDGGADPNNRRDMDWSVQSPLTDYLKALTRIRRSNKALTEGDFQLLSVKSDFLCYSRRFEEEITIIAFNLSSKKKKVTISLSTGFRIENGILTELVSLKSIRIKKGKVKLTMEPRQVDILKISE